MLRFVAYSVLRRNREIAIQTERSDTTWTSTRTQTGKVRAICLKWRTQYVQTVYYTVNVAECKLFHSL